MHAKFILCPFVAQLVNAVKIENKNHFAKRFLVKVALKFYTLFFKKTTQFKSFKIMKLNDFE
jgi:hypothetical protein